MHFAASRHCLNVVVCSCTTAADASCQHIARHYLKPPALHACCSQRMAWLCRSRRKAGLLQHHRRAHGTERTQATTGAEGCSGSAAGRVPGRDHRRRSRPGPRSCCGTQRHPPRCSFQRTSRNRKCCTCCCTSQSSGCASQNQGDSASQEVSHACMTPCMAHECREGDEYCV